MKTFDKIFIDGEYRRVKDTHREEQEILEQQFRKITGTNGSNIMVSILCLKAKKLSLIVEGLYMQSNSALTLPISVSGTYSRTIGINCTCDLSKLTSLGILPNLLEIEFLGSEQNPGVVRSWTNGRVTRTVSGSTVSFAITGIDDSVQGKWRVYYPGNPSIGSNTCDLTVTGGPTATPTVFISVKKQYSDADTCHYFVLGLVSGYNPALSYIKVICGGATHLITSEAEGTKYQTYKADGKLYTVFYYPLKRDTFENADNIYVEVYHQGKKTVKTINKEDYI